MPVLVNKQDVSVEEHWVMVMVVEVENRSHVLFVATMVAATVVVMAMMTKECHCHGFCYRTQKRTFSLLSSSLFKIRFQALVVVVGE